MTMRIRENCDRCGASLKYKASIMSTFSTEIICIGCKEIERKHPSYPAADRAEVDAVRNGDCNFPGIGKPSDL